MVNPSPISVAEFTERLRGAQLDHYNVKVWTTLTDAGLSSADLCEISGGRSHEDKCSSDALISGPQDLKRLVAALDRVDGKADNQIALKPPTTTGVRIGTTPASLARGLKKLAAPDVAWRAALMLLVTDKQQGRIPSLNERREVLNEFWRHSKSGSTTDGSRKIHLTFLSPATGGAFESEEDAVQGFLDFINPISKYLDVEFNGAIEKHGNYHYVALPHMGNEGTSGFVIGQATVASAHTHGKHGLAAFSYLDIKVLRRGRKRSERFRTLYLGSPDGSLRVLRQMHRRARHDRHLSTPGQEIGKVNVDFHPSLHAEALVAD